MSKLPDLDRLVTIPFEADDEFLAELRVLQDEAKAFQEQADEFNRRQQEEYNAAVERFRERLSRPAKETVN